MSDNGASIETLAQWLAEAERAVAFTGAGVSTESGIEDFRSPGGFWTRHQPVWFEDFVSDPEARRSFWRQRREMIPGMLAARPNAGHMALSELERRGSLRGIITQNIDELHQRAGSKKVLEIHGTAMKVHCLSCDKRWPSEEIQVRLEAGEEEFTCDACGGLLKSMTVSFGQQLSPTVLMEASQWARESDLFIALGSSLVVYPAAELPAIAKRHRARLVIINRDETPLDTIADLVIHAPIGQTLGEVIKQCSPPEDRAPSVV